MNDWAYLIKYRKVIGNAKQGLFCSGVNLTSGQAVLNGRTFKFLCGPPGRRALPSLNDLSGHADVAPAGEVPGVGKIAALLGFHRLNLAVLAVEKDAGAVGLIDEGKATAVGAEPGVALDEVILL